MKGKRKRKVKLGGKGVTWSKKRDDSALGYEGEGSGPPTSPGPPPTSVPRLLSPVTDSVCIGIS